MNVGRTAAQLTIQELATKHAGVGETDFVIVTDLVRIASQMDMPGDEKKKRVLAALEQFGIKLGRFVLNLALELAVLWVQEELAKKAQG